MPKYSRIMKNLMHFGEEQAPNLRRNSEAIRTKFHDLMGRGKGRTLAKFYGDAAAKLKKSAPKAYQSAKDYHNAGQAVNKKALRDKALLQLERAMLEGGAPIKVAYGRAKLALHKVGGAVSRGVAPAIAAAAGANAAKPKKKEGFKYGGMAGCCPTCGKKR